MEHENLNTGETANSDLGALIKSLPHAERLKINSIEERIRAITPTLC